MAPAHDPSHAAMPVAAPPFADGAMSISGVPKPVWRAFELLHKHAGDRRLPVAISNQTAATPAAAAADAQYGTAAVSSPTPSDVGMARAQGEPLWAVSVPCNASDPTQTGWTYEGSALQWKGTAPSTAELSASVNAALCIDSSGAGGRAALSLLPCVYLQPSQSFAADGQGSYQQLGGCLDVYEPDPAGYRRLDIYRCHGSANQRFSLKGGLLSSGLPSCVAARRTSAGPPPPPPPSANKPYIAAMATYKRGSNGGGDGGGDGPMGGLRVFLSFWADPEASAGSLADREVHVVIKHMAGSAPSSATLHAIDDATVNPSAEWAALGRPDKPNSTQLAAILAASAVLPTPASLVVHNATATGLLVRMRMNSAVVIELA